MTGDDGTVHLLPGDARPAGGMTVSRCGQRVSALGPYRRPTCAECLRLDAADAVALADLQDGVEDWLDAENLVGLEFDMDPLRVVSVTPARPGMLYDPDRRVILARPDGQAFELSVAELRAAVESGFVVSRCARPLLGGRADERRES